MGARLLFTLICDDAREEKSGKLVVVGLYNYTINFQKSSEQVPQLFGRLGQSGTPRRKLGDAGLNTSVQQPTTRFALPQLCIVRRWYVDGHGHSAQTELIEPGGNRRLLADRELPVVEPDKHYQEIFAIAGFILTEGDYIIHTTVGESHFEEKFVVRGITAA